MKLRAKILILLIPLIVLPLLTLGWIAYAELRKATEQQVFGDMQDSIQYFEDHMATRVETAVANIELFAKNNLVRKYVLTADDQQRYDLILSPLLRVFRTYQEAFPDYYEIRILLPDGYEDARQTSPYLESKTDEEGESPFFQALAQAGDRTYTAIRRNPDNQQVSLYVGKALILNDRSVDPIGIPPKLRAYLVLTISLADFALEIGNRNIGENGFLFAVSGAGELLFQPLVRQLDRISASLLTDSDRTRSGIARVNLNGATYFIDSAWLHPEMRLVAALPE